MVMFRVLHLAAIVWTRVEYLCKYVDNVCMFIYRVPIKGSRNERVSATSRDGRNKWGRRKGYETAGG